MVNAEQAPQLLERGVVIGSDGERIGSVGQVYLDDATGTPTWVTVKTGWFGTSESFVPLDNASVNGDEIRVPYDKDKIKDAPNHDAGTPLSPEDEEQLYSYYGLGSMGAGYESVGAGYDAANESATVADTTGTYADRASVTDTTGTGDSMTRSEEQLHVGTERVQTGRARLRKYVVTENQTVTVPVSREEVRVEREPIGPGEAVGAVDIGEAAAEVTLTEERVVVGKETVPVERVRLSTETVTDHQQVTEAVRKEEIEYDTDADTTRATDRDRTDRI